MPMEPETELILIILPGLPVRPRSAPSKSRNAWVLLRTPIKLTSNWFWNSSGERFCIAPKTAMPALFTSPANVSPANASSTFSAAAKTAWRSVTSNINGTNCGPKSAATRAPSSSLRTDPKTRYPLSIRVFEICRPIPDDAPVTTTDDMITLLNKRWGSRLP